MFVDNTPTLFSFLQFTSSLQTQFEKVFDLSPILSVKQIDDRRSGS